MIIDNNKFWEIIENLAISLKNIQISDKKKELTLYLISIKEKVIFKKIMIKIIILCKIYNIMHNI